MMDKFVFFVIGKLLLLKEMLNYIRQNKVLMLIIVLIKILIINKQFEWNVFVLFILFENKGGMYIIGSFFLFKW